MYWGKCQIIEGDTSSPFYPGFAPVLIEFPKNIGKSRDKFYLTDHKTLSILVSTALVKKKLAQLFDRVGLLFTRKCL